MGVAVFIDSHAHLYDKKFRDDLDEVLARAHEAGIRFCLIPGDRLETSREAVALAIEHPGIFAAVGFHPHEARDCSVDGLDEIRRMAIEPKVVAIGEIGLDYYYDNSPRDTQKDVLRKQLRLAKEINLPVILHCRNAYADLITLLQEETDGRLRGVCHCFSGDEDDAKALLQMGFYISFAGPITFPKADRLRTIVSKVPVQRMLLETDSPYMAPQPRRGKRNEPAYVVYNAEKIAEIHGMGLKDIARITTRNAQLLFGFGKSAERPILAYELHNGLYINVTNNCTNKCVFCKRKTNPVVKGYELRLERDPTPEEIIEQIGDPSSYEEVVFCGFGEPLLRLDVVKKVCAWLREKNVKRIRINTNGQANLIHSRNIVPELVGLVDAFSISLNACDTEQYQKLCHSRFGIQTYDAVKDFIRECKKYFDDITVSIVHIEGVHVNEARRIAEEELGCNFRLRPYYGDLS